MARRPRIDLPRVTQHVIQRGSNRQPCVFRDIDRIRHLQDTVNSLGRRLLRAGICGDNRPRASADHAQPDRCHHLVDIIVGKTLRALHQR